MLTIAQIRLLRQAVSDADMWRGSIVGSDLLDFERQVEAFDARIAAMDEALDQVARDRLELRRLRKESSK